MKMLAKLLLVIIVCRVTPDNVQEYQHFYMLMESLKLCKHRHILLSLTFKKKTHFQTVYYIHIIEIPTNKGPIAWCSVC